MSGVTTWLLDGGGALHYPVACGNVPVLPSDVVLADETCVLIMPVAEAEAAADEALARQARPTGR